jgi:hypothetical protein
MQDDINTDELAAQIKARFAEIFETRLGPDIVADMKRMCPKDTGDLADSCGYVVEDGRLIVFASGSDKRAYAAYVEMGHEVSHGAGNPPGPEKVQPQPFMRPAVYREREI